MSTELLAVILGTGGVAMLGALVQAWRSIKAGSAQHERDAYSDLENSRRKEYLRRERAEEERDYWHTYAANLEYVIRTELPADKHPLRPPFPFQQRFEEDSES